MVICEFLYFRNDLDYGSVFFTALITSITLMQVSSVRYAGSPWDFKADALNIYQVEWYQSFEDFAESDNPNMIGYSGSLIVTGRSYWTLYE